MKKLLIEIAVVFSFVVICGILWTSNRNLRKDLNRWDSNWTNLIKKDSLQNSVISLQLDEFKKSVNGSLDSIMKVAKIKPKQVQDVTYVTNVYNSYDTTIIRPEPVI
jgi:hypothetical protein